MKIEYTSNHRESESKGQGGEHMTELQAALVNKLLYIFENEDTDTQQFWMDIILCFEHCGDGFFQEIQAAIGDESAIKAVVAKWLPTIKRSNKLVQIH